MKNNLTTASHPARALLVALPFSALLGACVSQSTAPVTTPATVATEGPFALAGTDPAATCAALKGTSVASAIVGLGGGVAMVTSADWTAPQELKVAPGGPTPASRISPASPQFCKVLGEIAARDPKAQAIRFQVNLPMQWNGRSVQFGGGGFNGSIPNTLGHVPGQRFDLPSPLAQGYVTVGTDSGHQSKPGESPMAFALNDEMLVNFAHASYPKVRNVSVELMKRAYGRSPVKLYFTGSSEGGREALTMAQRYPEAFDGIFSRVPVINWTGLQFSGARNGLASMGEAWIRPPQVKLVHDAVLAACDAADGLTDRVVSNPTACLRSFNPASLKCAPGQTGDQCLNDAQITAIRTLRSGFEFPYPLSNGLTRYPGWGIGGEDTPAMGPTGGWMAWWSGKAAPVIPPVPANGIAWFFGSGALQYFYAQNPSADPRSITPASVAPRVREVSALMDSTNPDLSAFSARGGKLILLEYMADYAQSPYAGIEYFGSVQARMGAGKVSEFARLFTAPGVDHVGSGAPGLTDPLGALANWVERARAPVSLTVAEQVPVAPFTPIRTRPLCEWPKYPRFKGGDASRADSFECSNP